MRSGLLSYKDAVRLLDGSQGPGVALAGRLAGVAVSGAVVATVGAIDFFALRDELVSWGRSLVGGLGERLAGLGRFDRTQRLVAAHSVVVVTAFYEALGGVLAEDGGQDDAGAGTGRRAGRRVSRRVTVVAVG